MPEPESDTFEASKGLAVFDYETLSFWVAPKPKDKSGVLYDELSSEDKRIIDASRFKGIDNLLQLGTLSVMTIRDSEQFVKSNLEDIPTYVGQVEASR